MRRGTSRLRPRSIPACRVGCSFQASATDQSLASTRDPLRVPSRACTSADRWGRAWGIQLRQAETPPGRRRSCPSEAGCSFWSRFTSRRKGPCRRPRARKAWSSWHPSTTRARGLRRWRPGPGTGPGGRARDPLPRSGSRPPARSGGTIRSGTHGVPGVARVPRAIVWVCPLMWRRPGSLRSGSPPPGLVSPGRGLRRGWCWRPAGDGLLRVRLPRLQRRRTVRQTRPPEAAPHPRGGRRSRAGQGKVH